MLEDMLEESQDLTAATLVPTVRFPIDGIDSGRQDWLCLLRTRGRLWLTPFSPRFVAVLASFTRSVVEAVFRGLLALSWGCLVRRAAIAFTGFVPLLLVGSRPLLELLRRFELGAAIFAALSSMEAVAISRFGRPESSCMGCLLAFVSTSGLGSELLLRRVTGRLMFQSKLSAINCCTPPSESGDPTATPISMINNNQSGTKDALGPLIPLRHGRSDAVL
jgi:hypothetical protein